MNYREITGLFAKGVSIISAVMKLNRLAAKLVPVLLMGTALGGRSVAQTLTVIKSPTGSEIVYGPLDRQAGIDDGLIYILKQVHGHYGAKPELGQFFKAKGADAIGTFFQVEDKNFTHRPQSGLVLLTKQSDGTVQAAVLTDTVDHFKTSINGMLRQVESVWYGSNGAQGASKPVQPLQTFPFPDGSGTIDLAAGWRPLAARAGGVIAVGPKGETLEASCYLGVLNSESPQVRRRLSSGQGLPGNYAAAPSNAGPSDTFNLLYNQLRQKHGLPTGQAHVTVAKTEHTQLGTEYVMSGDFQDPQTGPQKIIVRMSAGPVNPRTGGWGCMMSSVTAPATIFADERPTLLAMVNSLSQNDSVIRGEGNAASDRIRAYGERVRANTTAKQKAFDQYMSGIDAMHDNQAAHSAAFQDFLLDQSVVEHTPSGLHARLYNDDANALVQSNPDKFQIVPGSQYIKGRDY